MDSELENPSDDTFDVIHIGDSKMDIHLVTILKDNGLYDDLYEILNDHNLTIDILSKIQTNEFEQLCTDLHLSIIQKAKFRTLMDAIDKTVYDEGDQDIQLKELLDKNKLSHLYSILKRERITFVKLESLTTADIDHICYKNNIHIGTKMDVQDVIEQHQREIIQQNELELYRSTPGNPVFAERIERNDNTTYDAQMKIILVGDSGVGKTALLRRFVSQDFDISAYVSTIGIDCGIARKRLGDGTIIKMTIWDTGGQERFRSIPRSYYHDTDAIIVCYAVNSKESFRECNEWRKEIEQYAPDNIIVMLLGCKADVKYKKNERNKKYGQTREVSYHDASNMAHSVPWRKLNAQWGECSAMTGVNVNSTFMTVAELRIGQRKQRKSQNRIHIEEKQPDLPEPQVKESCCGAINQAVFGDT